MLFIHHNETETMKLYLVVEEGMRPDDQGGVPLRDAFEEVLPRFAFNRTGEQHDFYVQGL